MTLYYYFMGMVPYPNRIEIFQLHDRQLVDTPWELSEVVDQICILLLDSCLFFLLDLFTIWVLLLGPIKCNLIY